MHGTNRSPIGILLSTRLGACLALTAACAFSAEAAPVASKKVPLPRPRPAIQNGKQAAAPAARIAPLPQKRPAAGGAAQSSYAQANVGLHGTIFESHTAFKPLARPVSGPFALAPTAATSAADVAAVKRVIEAARRGKEADANAAEASITDPVARKLAEWVILRSDNTNPTFQRYAAFVEANPSWPHAPLFRRRAENALWNDGIDDRTVRAFFARQQPSTAKGRFMLARTLLTQGDRDAAAALVRQAWRNDECSAEVEKRVLEMFGNMLTTADHKARMEHRFYADDVVGGMRAAERLGGNEVVIAKARTAVLQKAGNAKAALDAVPASAQSEPGYIFARVQWLRDGLGIIKKAAETGKIRIFCTISTSGGSSGAFWCASCSTSATRKLPIGWRVKPRHQCAASTGWMRISPPDGSRCAISTIPRPRQSISPASWKAPSARTRLRAAAIGRAARPKQWANARRPRLSTNRLRSTRPPITASLRAHGLASPTWACAARHHSRRKSRTCSEISRSCAPRKFSMRSTSATCSHRSLPSSVKAAPTSPAWRCLASLPASTATAAPCCCWASTPMRAGYHSIITLIRSSACPTTSRSRPIEAAVAYSIARQESHFNQKVVSTAHAMGLMQVTPAAGIDTAAKYKVAYSRDRLLKDPVYNMQMGAAELSNLFNGYNGSYILTFAGYNAGRGRVRQWIAAYGDPRDPNIDPVDWVERIPLSETRNYVERIMENLQVYRARFGGGTKLLIEADIKRGGLN